MNFSTCKEVHCVCLPEQASASVPIESLSLAMEHHEFGRYQEAEAIYRKILEDDSGSPELYKNLGNTLRALGNFVEAESMYRQALRMKPDFGEAYNNLGNILSLQKRFDEAEEAFRQAFAFMPGRAEIHNNLGNLLFDSGRYEEAEKSYRKAIVLNPDYHQAYANRGNSLLTLGRRDAAVKSYQRAIELKPDYVEALVGLGQTLNHLGRLEEAEKAHRQAIALKPDCAEGYNGLANVLMDLGRFEHAEQLYCTALSLKPDDASALFNRSWLQLMLGNYEQGFKGYESRFKGGSSCSFSNIQEMFNQLHAQARWNGDSLASRSLLILAEQGVGDSLMMMRYIHLLKQFNPDRLVVYCPLELQRLFETVPAVSQVIPWTAPLPLDGIDSYCPIMSFPYIFRTSLQTVPGEVPYLYVPDSIKRKWRERLGHYNALKVGLAWAGNPQFVLDKFRSIPFEEFTPLFKVEGIQMFSLQKGNNHSQVQDLPENLIDWMSDCSDFLDTAALVDELDLVISVDTAIAHLAGALGRQVWLLNRAGSEWRWMTDREDSPWYPTMKLFRQQKKEDWTPVIRRVVDELVYLQSQSALPKIVV